VNKEELFNLRHASARNVIERIFGVLKRRFRILLIAPEFSLGIQARIPAALCAIHNFIRTHDTDDTPIELEPTDYAPNDHDHIASETEAAGADRSSSKRDIIAEHMWEEYLRICSERGISEDNQSDDEELQGDDDDGDGDDDGGDGNDDDGDGGDGGDGDDDDM
jgi:hypothetical protein